MKWEAVIMRYVSRKISLTCGVALGVAVISSVAADAQAPANPPVSSSTTQTSDPKLDFVGATPLLLPIAPTFSDAEAFKAISTALAPSATTFNLRIPGSSIGDAGSGNKNVIQLGTPAPQV